MQEINKVLKSKIAPNDPNVIWIDLSSDKLKLKSYNNGAWNVVSGDEENIEIATTEEIDALFDEGGGGGSGSGSSSSGSGGGENLIYVTLDDEWSNVVVGGSPVAFYVSEDKSLCDLDTFDKWSNVMITSLEQSDFVPILSLVSYSQDINYDCTARVTIENPETLDTIDIIFEWHDTESNGTYHIDAS